MTFHFGAGSAACTNPMPTRYVILRHDGIDHPHFDLMFETAPGSQLATWRSDVWPITRPTPVERLPDHRAAYLDYEGPVSNNRGRVSRVESGLCRLRRDETVWHIELSTEGRGLQLRLLEDGGWEAVPGAKTA